MCLDRLCFIRSRNGQKTSTISELSSWLCVPSLTFLVRTRKPGQIQFLWNVWRSCASEFAYIHHCSYALIRYIANRQPGKALPYFLRLRRPNVFDLIRENNLFTDVQDQVLLLVDFDHELMEKRKSEGRQVDGVRSEAITLLVDHIHSIPVSAGDNPILATEFCSCERQIGRVVQQLQGRPYYLFLYLDALFEKDPHSASNFADTQVRLGIIVKSQAADDHWVFRFNCMLNLPRHV
jgi:hypothetical protein